MATDVLLLLEIALTAIILVRAIIGKFRHQYPLFFAYLVFQFLMSIGVLLLYSHPAVYLGVYWYIQFLSVALGYSVVWEMYAHVLVYYPGALRMARFVVSIFLIGALAWALMNAYTADSRGLTRSVVAFERNVRTIQILLLSSLFVLIWYYALPISRNVRGLIGGYSLFVALSVLSLTIRSHIGIRFQIPWSYLQQASYLISLVIWTVAFWRYSPLPAPDEIAAPERDYEAMADRTGYALLRAKSSFIRTFRQR